MTASSPSEDTLVYGELNGDLVALRQSRARELASIHGAITEVGTWQELRARIPAEDFAVLVGLLEEEPAPDDSFTSSEVGALEDWPEWPQQCMLDLIPQEVQQALGSVEFSAVSGDALAIPIEREHDFVSALGERGWRLRRDDDLVRRASGHL